MSYKVTDSKKCYEHVLDLWCFDNYDNIREDLTSIGYDRGYINNQPLWKLKDLYNKEYLGK